jgi:hypothetical protein
MPGQEVNPQPIAKFAPGKTYVIKGETLNKLLQGNLPIRAGKGLKEHATPQGRIFTVDGELGGGVQPCALGYVYEEGADTKLQGGIVTGGSSNVDVDPITLTLSSTDGTWLWLRVDFTANEADDVLIPGIDDIDTVATGSGTSIPANIIPTMSSPSGRIYIPLGQYNDGAFMPGGCGNIILTHCPGSIGYYRV